MCYSAQVWADFRSYVRRYGANVDIKQFYELYVKRSQSGKDVKIPKGMDFAFQNPTSLAESEIFDLIQAHNASVVRTSEEELFKQSRRLADAERTLAVKTTKKALEDQRIAGNKIRQMKRWITDAKRSTLDHARDDRIFPDWYAPVLIVEDGKPLVRPMRYHCRPAGMPASIDRTKDGRISGTYNARRDNLTRFWRGQFGHSHGLMIADVFYEQVDDGAGGSKEIEFTPRTGDDMLIACLVSHWTDPLGVLPDLWSYAAVTDEPEPEVEAAGHDRTIINLRPEHVDKWLRPDSGKLDALFSILDDRRHPYYEHRLAA